MSKGHKRRAEDFKQVQENWDSIDWGKKPDKKEIDMRNESEKMLDKYFQEQ